MDKSEFYYSLRKYLARISQFSTWPIAFLYFNILFKVRITGQHNLKNFSSPFIIIANHIAFFDSFVFRLVLGLFSNKLPLRFMAVNKFKIWYLNLLASLFIIDIIYIVFGVFVIKPGKGIEKNLAEAIRIIKNGGNVLMYPEGSIMHTGKIERFKLGAAVLAKKTRVTVLPISMRIFGRGLRKKYVINIGAPMVDLDYSMNAIDLTSIFHDRVEELYNKKYDYRN